VVDIKAESPPTMFIAKSDAADGEFRFLVDEEMVESVQMYLDHVRSRVKKGKGTLDVEQKLDMTHLHPDIWGTGDATYYDARDQWLFVDDLKYGKGVSVDIEDNPQLMLYGAGAVDHVLSFAAAGYGTAPLGPAGSVDCLCLCLVSAPS